MNSMNIKWIKVTFQKFEGLIKKLPNFFYLKKSIFKPKNNIEKLLQNYKKIKILYSF